MLYRPIWAVLQVQSEQEGEPVLFPQAEPGQTPRADAQPPGAAAASLGSKAAVFLKRTEPGTNRPQFLTVRSI